MVLIVISISIIGFVVGFYYFSILARTQADKANKESFRIQADKLAIEKRKEEKTLAAELKEENRRLAIDLKDSMLTHIEKIANTIRADLELHKTILLSQFNMLVARQETLQKEVGYHKENQSDINQGLQKSLDMVNQFTWGVDAKSVPPYVTGDVESQEHKDKPSEGIFSSPDSTETQEEKDANS